MELVTAVDLPTVGLYPKIGSIVRLHREVEDWRGADRDAPQTNHWQLKNHVRDDIRGILTAKLPEG